MSDDSNIATMTRAELEAYAESLEGRHRYDYGDYGDGFGGGNGYGYGDGGGG